MNIWARVRKTCCNAPYSKIIAPEAAASARVASKGPPTGSKMILAPFPELIVITDSAGSSNARYQLDRYSLFSYVSETSDLTETMANRTGNVQYVEAVDGRKIRYRLRNGNFLSFSNRLIHKSE